ncbi:hypothetical protein LTR22_025672 [Elasticomyces elasticus]|nr:hypothetical protein LTR22_025672 [Elasticomyces elasticus]
MSNYYYPPQPTPLENDVFDFSQAFALPFSQASQCDQTYIAQPTATSTEWEHLCGDEQQFYYQSNHYQQPLHMNISQHTAWETLAVPSNYPRLSQSLTPFPLFPETFDYSQTMVTAGPSVTSFDYLFPEELAYPSRATSNTSDTSSAPNLLRPDVSRSTSPSASEMARWAARLGRISREAAIFASTTKGRRLIAPHAQDEADK